MKETSTSNKMEIDSEIVTAKTENIEEDAWSVKMNKLVKKLNSYEIGRFNLKNIHMFINDCST